MAPKTTQELASEYLELVRKNIKSPVKVAELCSAWLAKHLNIIHRHKDEDRHFLRQHATKV